MRKIFSGRRPSRDNPFKFSINPSLTSATSTPALDFQLPITTPTSGGLVAFQVDWGDGNVGNYNAGSTPIIHTYAGPGTYVINIYGSLRGWSFGTMALGHDDACKMLTIANWGCWKGTNNQAFRDCVNMTAVTATDTPTFEYTFTLSQMFRDCADLTVVNKLDDWNIGASGTFTGCTTTAEMFRGCGKFNSSNSSVSTQPDLIGWNSIILTSTASMFWGCTNFNGRVFKVWSTTNQTSFMFYNCKSYNNAANASITAWDTSGVTTMRGMFYGASVFNQNISTWSLSSCTDISRMFASASSFNAPIGVWNTSGVTQAWGVFQNAGNFDQNIANWNLSNISGNPTVSGWDTPGSGMNLSQANYNALLIGWDAYNYPSVNSGTWNFGNSTYDCPASAAATARASLVTKWGGINDGGCT